MVVLEFYWHYDLLTIGTVTLRIIVTHFCDYRLSLPQHRTWSNRTNTEILHSVNDCTLEVLTSTGVEGRQPIFFQLLIVYLNSNLYEEVNLCSLFVRIVFIL